MNTISDKQNIKASTKYGHGMDASIEESKNYKNMKKNVKQINESQLRAIVAESVKKVLKEEVDCILGSNKDILSEAEYYMQQAQDALYRFENTIEPTWRKQTEIDAVALECFRKGQDFLKNAIFQIDDAFQYLQGGIKIHSLK